jgi:hypothetical protein
MHHQDQDPQPLGDTLSSGNRPARGARIIESSSDLASHVAKDDAVDFLGLDGTAPNTTPQAVSTPQQLHAAHHRRHATTATATAPAAVDSWLLDSPSNAAETTAAELLQPEAPLVPAAAPQESTRAAAFPLSTPAQPVQTSARRWTLYAALALLCAAGGGAYWWQTTQPTPQVAVQIPQPKPVAKPVRVPTPAVEVAPVAVAPVEVATVEPAPVELTTAEPAPVKETGSPVASVATPSLTTPSIPLDSSSWNAQPTHEALGARWMLGQRMARRHNWSLLGLHGSLPAQRRPAGSGLVAASVLPVITVPAITVPAPTTIEVRDVVGARRVTPDEQPHLHADTTVPMERIHETRRVLTPKVGRVRVTVSSGEVFEGRLYAIGEGSVWLDTDLGRMALPADGVRGVETLSSTAQAPVLGDKGSQALAGLRRVRVVCEGGVFTGALLSQQGDEVLLMTDEGSRIKLKALRVESVSREGTQVRGRISPQKKQ